MRVIWSRRAIQRLSNVHDYIAEDSPTDALRMIDRLTLRTGALTDHPELGRVVPEYRLTNVRELIEGGYRILYRIVGDNVRILSVRHGSKPLPKRLRNL